MRFVSIITAIGCLTTATQAYVSDLAVPQIIKPGDVFTATGHQLLSQPRPDTMIWGITKYDYEWNNFPWFGDIGSMFARTDLNKVLGGAYNITIPDLKIPASTESGDYAIQAIILNWSGARNAPSLESWFWNVTIGSTTSKDRVNFVQGGPNSKHCNLQ